MIRRVIQYPSLGLSLDSEEKYYTVLYTYSLYSDLEIVLIGRRVGIIDELLDLLSTGGRGNVWRVEGSSNWQGDF